MTSQILKNKKDWSKWATFFEDMAKGKIPHSSAGYYIVDAHPEWSSKESESDKPVINLVTPVAQTLEQAKADLQQERAKKRPQQPEMTSSNKRLSNNKISRPPRKSRRKERYGVPGSQYRR